LSDFALCPYPSFNLKLGFLNVIIVIIRRIECQREKQNPEDGQNIQVGIDPVQWLRSGMKGGETCDGVLHKILGFKKQGKAVGTQTGRGHGKMNRGTFQQR
jgi:hypothetical protein